MYSTMEPDLVAHLIIVAVEINMGGRMVWNTSTTIITKMAGHPLGVFNSRRIDGKVLEGFALLVSVPC